MEAGTTVNLRVQVIDLTPVTLDLQVPTYLPARDLTQRVARDAGLEAFWPDGRRRLYWLRARGRLVRDEEKLSDLNVVNGELVYLLPEPPAGSGVVERPPEHPETHDYGGQGLPVLFGSLLLVLAWSIGWGAALAQSRTLAVVTLPGLALGLFCTALARHAWGGAGSRVRIVATGLALQLCITVIAFLSPVLFASASVLDVYRESVPGLILGMLGAFVGWAAWWGAVEPLPARTAQAAAAVAQTITTVPCGICGGPVEPDVRLDCTHACGQHFHKGCWNARQAVYRGDRGRCAICTRPVGGAQPRAVG